MGIILQVQARVDVEILSSTVTYGSGTWTRSQEHKKLIDRRNARCSVSSFKQRESTRRKTKKERTTENQRATKNTHSDEGNSTNTGCDQDSDVSFQSDSDDEVHTAEVEEEEWIEQVKRSTRDAEDKMRAANIPCWIEAQRKMKWRLAVRIASHPEQIWTEKQQRGTLDRGLKQKQAEE